MKVGDLVRNGQGHVGVVTGMGYSGKCLSYKECRTLNPDVHVIAPMGKRLWSYKALKVISESR